MKLRIYMDEHRFLKDKLKFTFCFNLAFICVYLRLSAVSNVFFVFCACLFAAEITVFLSELRR